MHFVRSGDREVSHSSSFFHFRRFGKLRSLQLSLTFIYQAAATLMKSYQESGDFLFNLGQCAFEYLHALRNGALVGGFTEIFQLAHASPSASAPTARDEDLSLWAIAQICWASPAATAARISTASFLADERNSARNS